MAINYRPDIRCANAWPHIPEPQPPAVAVVNDPRDPADVYRPRCQSCVEGLSTVELPSPWLVVYLDPSRQRRPQPDDHDHDHDPDLGPGVYDYPHAPAP